MKSAFVYPILTNMVAETLVKSALTLQERMARCSHERGNAEFGCSKANPLIEQWKIVLNTVGDSESFDHRLRWSGWERAGIAPAMLDENIDFYSPRWLDIIAGAVERTATEFQSDSLTPPDCNTWLNANRPLPFQELFVGVVDYAYACLLEKLDRQGGTLSPRICPTGTTALGWQLLRQITELAEFALFREFEKFRPAGKSIWLKIKGGPRSSNKRRYYAQFIHGLGRNGLKTLFTSYPVLARMIGTRVNQWIESTAEFVLRLERDWEELSCIVTADASRCMIETLESGMSDSHHDGRTVIVLRYSNGGRLVYKPRELELDRALARFVVWFCKGSDFTLRVPTTLAKEGYGWAEYIGSSSMNSAADVVSFYHDAGALLFLVYLLGGTDCHRENLVACDNQLVLIDPETLFHAEIELRAPEVTSTADDAEMELDTVLKTGFLPTWSFGSHGKVAVDDSGLGSPAIAEGESSPGMVKVWRAINSDEMHLASIDAEIVPGSNEPRLKGASVNPADYVDDLIAGFRSAYRHCITRRDELLAESVGPLSWFRGANSRYVFRPTGVYDAIYRQSLKPDVLSSGIAWGLKLELLIRAALIGREKPQFWPMLTTELQHMTRFDVPYFSVDLDCDKILQEDGSIGEIRQIRFHSGIDAARNRISQLCESGLSLQCELIRATYIARTQGSVTRASHFKPDHPLDRAEAPHLDEAACTREALNIAELLRRRSLSLENTPQWLGFHNVPQADRLQLDLVSQGLYDGVAGIAIFLAAVDHVTARNEYLPLWTGALGPLRGVGENPSIAPRFARRGLGAGSGLGGLIYACVVLSELAPDQQQWLLGTAQTLSELFTEPTVSSDTMLDVISGCAGGILGLLALFEKTGNEGVLQKARRCGRQLVRKYTQRLQHASTASNPPLTGFSHGASGIALAITRLARFADGDQLLDLACKTLDYENRLYDKSENNWPDLRPNDGKYMTSWCHGAPGVAMARLGLVRTGLLNSSLPERDWRFGVKKILDITDLGIDHLCCGNLGLSEVLLESAVEYQLPGLKREAIDRTSVAVQRARETNTYRLFGGGTETVFNPGFFQGLAGIGYELLRFVRPQEVPSVLLFETRRTGGLSLQ